jgi:uncharacterized protein (TIGR02118 family)
LPTSKVFVFARAREGVAAAELVDWFAGTYADALAAAAVRPTRYVLNICDVVPVYRIAPFIAASGAARPAYDVGVELWFDEAVPDAGSGLPGVESELGRLADTVHTYRVEEKVLYTPPPGTPVDIKFMALGRWLPHLNDEEGRQHWTEHARLVPKVHVGVNRYVQNWVTGAIPADAPRVTGIAELHFPSVQSLGDEFYSSAEGQAEIRADVSRFTEGATTLCVRERVVFDHAKAVV